MLFQCYYSGLDLKKNDYTRVRKVGDSPEERRGGKVWEKKGEIASDKVGATSLKQKICVDVYFTL